MISEHEVNRNLKADLQLIQKLNDGIALADVPAEQKSVEVLFAKQSIELRSEYQYDAQRNWTERAVWSRLAPNPDFQRSNVTRREITYYAG